MPGYPALPEGLAYGGDYNPEQWPEEVWQEDVRLMRQAGVNLVTVGVFNWGLIEPAEGVYDFDRLDRIFDLLHSEGIKVDLGTPTSSPPVWFRNRHPGSRLVDREGHVLGGATRHSFCPSSPEYAAASERVAGRLAERYAGHPALAMWHVHNEYGWANAHCYCPTSAEAFRAWLRERYGDVGAVNAAWGTTFWGLTYGSFDEVEPPLLAPPGLLTGLQLDFMRFSVDAHIANYRREREAVRRFSDLPVTTNFMIPNCKPMDYWRWSAEVDVVANDHYLDAETPDAHIGLAMAADLTRSVSGGRPWMLMEHSTGAVNWQPRNLAKRRGEMRRNSLAHVARGSDSVMFFQWRASRHGAEKFHSAMVPHAGTDSEVWRDVVDLGADLGRLAPVRGSRVEADVAVVWDWESYWALELEWRPSADLGFRERVGAFYEALWREHVTVDFVHPSADLSAYRLVVVPSAYLLTEGSAKNLHRYVEAGGHLLVSFFSGIVDENDAIHGGPYPGVLREVLGLSVEEFHPLREHGTVAVSSGAGEYAGRIWSERVRLGEAAALWTFADGPDAGHPAVTRHDLGAGAAWYVATALDEASGSGPRGPYGLRGLLGEVLDHAGVRRLADVPEDVEVVRRGAHLFLFNHGDRPVTVPGVTGTGLLDGVEHRGSATVPPGGVAVVRT
ncbi:beta-galactosidase [Planotetraspora phitsanulokensis]|uniref:Beta-galactosidase n=1 Tax=Planotetraspora phitsanulokensis TaxID=575192 RepID=A0A8J3XGV1_9ACTN|nr:beta-galactosidase [Planotetraspora phitsanulokensis]GII39381.1 beta-galactosidase [Planotetraspora phitsanulokensis]